MRIADIIRATAYTLKLWQFTSRFGIFSEIAYYGYHLILQHNKIKLLFKIKTL
jgi:hypothetical protein